MTDRGPAARRRAETTPIMGGRWEVTRRCGTCHVVYMLLRCWTFTIWISRGKGARLRYVPVFNLRYGMPYAKCAVNRLRMIAINHTHTHTHTHETTHDSALASCLL